MSAHTFPKIASIPLNTSTIKIHPYPVVLAGPSGVGKSTFIKRLLKDFPNSFSLSVSHTTRDPRPGETDGVHYHFTDRGDFESRQKNGEFLETADVHGNLYGTTFQAVKNVLKTDKACILDVDIQGVFSIQKSELKVRSYIFIVPPTFQALSDRLSKRGEPEESLARRLKTAKWELSFMDDPVWNHVIVNDDLETAYSTFQKIIIEDFSGEENAPSSSPGKQTQNQDSEPSPKT